MLAGLPGLHGRRRRGRCPRRERGARGAEVARSPTAVTCSGVIRTLTRCCPARRFWYSSSRRVLLRELVDLRVGVRRSSARPRRRRRSTCRDRRVDDGQRGARILLEVRRLRAPVRRVERRDAVLDVDPDDGVVRRAVLAERRDDADEGLLQELAAALRSASPSVSPRRGFRLVIRLPARSEGFIRAGCRSRPCGSHRVSSSCGVAFVLHERRSALERPARLGGDAARRPARARPLPELRRATCVDVTLRGGRRSSSTPTAIPTDFTDLKRPICQALQRFPHDVAEPALRAACYTRADCPQRSSRTCSPCTRSRTSRGTCTAIGKRGADGVQRAADDGAGGDAARRRRARARRRRPSTRSRASTRTCPTSTGRRVRERRAVRSPARRSRLAVALHDDRRSGCS